MALSYQDFFGSGTATAEPPAKGGLSYGEFFGSGEGAHAFVPPKTASQPAPQFDTEWDPIHTRGETTQALPQQYTPSMAPPDTTPVSTLVKDYVKSTINALPTTAEQLAEKARNILGNLMPRGSTSDIPAGLEGIVDSVNETVTPKAEGRFELESAKTPLQENVRWAGSVTGGLGDFVAELALARKIPGFSRLSPEMRNAAAWEMVSQSQGGVPGEGTAMSLTLSGIQAIPLRGPAAETLKVGLESALFGGTAYAEGAEGRDIAVAAGLPMFFGAYRAARAKGVPGTEQMDALTGVKPDPKIDEILAKENPSRADAEAIGLEGKPNAIERAQTFEAIRRAKREMKANVEEGMEVQPTRRDQIQQFAGELGRPPTKAEVAERFDVSREEAGGMINSTDFGGIRELAEGSAKPAEAPMVTGPRVNENLRARAKELGIKVGGLSDDAVLKRVRAAEAAQENAGAEAATGEKIQAARPEVLSEASAPAEATEPSWLSKKGTKSRSEFMDALQELTRHAAPKLAGEGKGSSNPLDPEFLKLAGNAAAKAIKAGMYTSAEFIEHVTASVGREYRDRLRPYLQQAWSEALAKSDLRGGSRKAFDLMDYAKTWDVFKNPDGTWGVTRVGTDGNPLFRWEESYHKDFKSAKEAMADARAHTVMENEGVPPEILERVSAYRMLSRKADFAGMDADLMKHLGSLEQPPDLMAEDFVDAYRSKNAERIDINETKSNIFGSILDHFKKNSDSPSPTAQSQSWLSKKGTKSRSEFDGAIREFAKYTSGRVNANPLDPQMLKLAGNVVAKGVKAGAYSFGEFVEDIGNRLGHEVVVKFGPALEQAWNDARKTMPHLSEVKPVAEMFPRKESKPYGRPELANPATENAARQMVDIVDETRKQQGVPAVRSDTQVHAEAQQRLTADYAGEKQRLISTARDGGTLGDTDTVVAKSIVNREVMTAIKSGDLGAIRDSMDLVESYRETGTEAGRGFRQRRDPVETPEQRNARLLGEAILEPPAKTQKAIRKAREAGEPEKVEKLKNQWAEKVTTLREDMKKSGLDLDNVEEIVKDPVRAARALGAVKAAKSSNWDALYEYWRNSILSFPGTHIANTVGTAGHAAWNLTVERMLEAGVNTVLRRPDAARLGEFRYMLQGLMPGISRASRNAIRTFQSEQPFLEVETGGRGATKLDEPGGAIAGTRGRVVRAFGDRALLAEDEFAKSIVATVDVGAQAYRIAKAEKLAGEALAQRISELVSDLKSEAWQRAMNTAREASFQGKAGPITRGTLGLRNHVPFLRYLLPFVTTPGNILKAGITKSPAGILKLAADVAKGDWSKVPRDVAQQVIAWGALAALYGLFDDEDPWITGSRPRGREYGAKTMAQRTYPLQSIKIPGTDIWMSYARIEPFATTLGLMVDTVGSLRNDDAAQIPQAIFDSFRGQLSSKSFLQGIGDIVEALDQGQGGEDKLARWASSFIVSWVPNVVRGTGRTLQEQYPERGVWGNGKEYLERLVKRTVQKTELGILEDVPSVDVWGRPAPRSAMTNRPATDFVFRMLLPTLTKKEDVFLGDRVLMAWNRQHPDERKYPGIPAKYYTDRDGKHYMTDAEYNEYLTLAGQYAADAVDRMSLDDEYPDEKDIKRVEKAISDGRAKARKELFGR